LVHEPANWEGHYRARERAGKVLRPPRRLFYRGAYRAERPLHPRASRPAAIRAARRKRDRGQADVLDLGKRGHHFAVPAWPRPSERVRRAELETTLRGRHSAQRLAGNIRPECPDRLKP